MSGEILPTHESAPMQFTKFVDSHADIVLEANSIDPDMTRYSIWTISNVSKLVPIDSVHFKVSIDLERDKTMYHEIRFSYKDTNVFWVGYDSSAGVFWAAIGDHTSDVDFSDLDVASLVDELSSREQVGELFPKNS